jgi:hypothetical protein
VATHHVSGSKTALAAHCLWWARGDVEEPERTTSAAAEEGTTEHGHIEHTIKTGDTTPRSPTHAAWLEEWYEGHKHEPWRAEPAFALTPASGEALELPDSAGHRDYSAAPPGAIPLTLDAVRVDGDTVYVVDWKCGHAAHVAPAWRNAQLLTGALAAATVYGCTQAVVGIARCGPDGVNDDDVAEFDALDLEDWRDVLVSYMEAIPTAEPVQGPHCRGHFCAQLGRCPATAPALEDIAPEKPRLPVVVDAGAIESDEHASYLYHFVRAAKARADLVFEALRIFADKNGGIPVGDGTVWIRSEVTSDVIELSSPLAVAVLRKELGEHFDEAVTFDTTKKALKAVGRTLKATTKEPISAFEARVVDALREVGAVKTRTSTNYDEKKIKEAA